MESDEAVNFDETDLQVRLDFVDQMQVDFDKSQTAVERLDLQELCSDARSKFANTYLVVKSQISRELGKQRRFSAVNSTALPHVGGDSRPAARATRLPEFKLPRFSGAYIDWPDFYAMYNTIVGNNDDLSNVEKFQHLRSCLDGTALDTIRSLEPTEANYEKAIELLVSRFDNKLLHFQAHIRSICGISGVEQGSAASLRRLSDQMNSHLRALNTMATTQEIMDGLLIYLVASKLDRHTREKWEEALQANKLLKWKDMATFLEKRCRMLENLENAMVIQTPSKQHSALAVTTEPVIQSETDSLPGIVKRFWEIDSYCGSPIVATDEDVLCEQLFQNTFSRLSSGQYSVRLPAKASFDMLGDSYGRALRRFKTLEGKLLKDVELKSQYAAFINEYIDLQHMSLASEQSVASQYYLPHHCVQKPDSTTTKLRVVFDGSAKTTSGYSLNDLLFAGPSMQPKIFNTLLRFRFFKVALCGDICKMYRCVRVTSPDNYLQSILWRDNPNQQVKAYTLDTVTYGTKPAAFLAIRAMQQLSYDEEAEFLLAAKIIRRDFYVDDLISGGGSIEEAAQIREQVKELLSKGHFPIRKWCSNEAAALEGEPEIDREKTLRFHDGTDVLKALGLYWDAKSDHLLFSLSGTMTESGATKRSILSAVAKFYDPLGLIAPIVTKLKIFLQILWKDKLDWDESLPQSLHSSWLEHMKQMSAVNHLKFPRFVMQPNSSLEIHAFCDASLAAIAQIQDLTKGMTWRHVPTHWNPADILSRGCSPLELLESNLWREGPPFLRSDSSCWPNIAPIVDDLPERRRMVLVVAEKQDISFDCKFQNSFGKLQRGFGYIYRFWLLKFQNQTRRKGPLTVDDVKGGTHLLIKGIQRVSFAEDYKALRKNKQVASNSKLSSLHPILDDSGLIRVGGRLQNSLLDYDARHPILLPKDHPVTQAIVAHFHHKFLHAGPQSLLAALRQRFWPIGGRKTVAAIVNKCIRCFRLKPRMMEHIMAPLPASRVQPSRPFTTTGIDFCGPFFSKSEVRNRPPAKCYVAVFICFATKASHLELVEDLSTASFLAALKRFTSIRGKPNTIWSDNATNFVGAKNELQELREIFLADPPNIELRNDLLSNGINWQFIPPARLILVAFSAMLNSRPLCPISENPSDLEVLTPGHFLIGTAFNAIDEPDITHLNINRLIRWQRVCQMQQVIWRKWSTAYLSLLQERGKWRSEKANLSPGSIVIIKDDNLPSLQWRMGRVESIVLGPDGVARVAVIRTAAGIIRRAVGKLAVLPFETTSSVSVTLPAGGACSEQNP
ncbi:uncharacterized protein LOC122320346 [Drosophila ficusphila]|uniref:uncharacterized protein LOC122320346 n=1 Tax=Drosophila ficusphila TaxID=30025 RepID=UPI001C8A9901|nr:uncharacterized protein LOC122320346 [Drosophila ficusphila]